MISSISFQPGKFVNYSYDDAGRVALAPFIERHPMASINEIFAAIHDGTVSRRAILVPEC